MHKKWGRAIDTIKHLLIIEPHLSGHHFRYLDFIASAACDHGWDVTIATDFVYQENHALKTLPVRYPGKISLNFFDFSNAPSGNGFAKLIRREFYYWRKMRRVFREIIAARPISHVLLPFADTCLNALAINHRIFGDCPWSAIAMRPSFHCYEMGLTTIRPGLLTKIKKILFIHLVNVPNPGKIFVIDPRLVDYIEKRSPHSRIVYLQDPVDVSQHKVGQLQARDALGLSSERSTVLVYGSVDGRKGLKELLAAQTLLSELNQPIILIAGKQTREIRIFLKQRFLQEAIEQKRILVIDRFISDTEESLLFEACDAVWLGYRGHLGSSGVLWQALAFTRMIIACDEGLIGWLTRTYGLGVTVNVSDSFAVSVILRNLQSLATSSASRPNEVIEKPLVPITNRDFAYRLIEIMTAKKNNHEIQAK